MDIAKSIAPTSLTEEDAAHYVAYTPSALRKWRKKGSGPAYIRHGRSIRYRVRDLDDWLDGHRVETRDARGRR